MAAVLGRALTSQPVVTAVTTRLEVTLTLVLGAIVVSAVVSAVLGVWAALRGGWVDRLVQVISVLGFAIPGFLLAVFLVRAFALGTHWFKPTGYVPPGISFSGWIQTVTLDLRVELSLRRIRMCNGDSPDVTISLQNVECRPVGDRRDRETRHVLQSGFVVE